MSLIKVKGSSINGALAAVDGSALTGIDSSKLVLVGGDQGADGGAGARASAGRRRGRYAPH